MGKSPCCSEDGRNRGPWTASEDSVLIDYIQAHGEGKWRSLPTRAGLNRCGKSCRLRWLNYLRPDIKRGNISHEEEDLILRLHRLLGNRWSLIAGRLPGRTDNEIKNYWNTTLARKSRGADSSSSSSAPAYKETKTCPNRLMSKKAGASNKAATIRPTQQTIQLPPPISPPNPHHHTTSAPLLQNPQDGDHSLVSPPLSIDTANKNSDHTCLGGTGYNKGDEEDDAGKGYNDNNYCFDLSNIMASDYSNPAPLLFEKPLYDEDWIAEFRNNATLDLGPLPLLLDDGWPMSIESTIQPF